jgi:hypothetical protein
MAPKEPQDHKEPIKGSTFTTTAGVLNLPHPSRIPSGVIRRTRKLEDQVDQFFSILEGLFGEDSDELLILDKLPMDELGDIFNEWMQDAQPGESSGSSI